MKNVKLLVVIFVLFLGSSCKKQDSLQTPVDIASVKAQLVALPILTKDQVETAMAEPKLKSAILEPTLVEIFDLSPETYFVSNEVAIKNLLYMEIDQNGNRKKMITIHQIFEVKNGMIDTQSYRLEFEIGCPYSRDFCLSQNGNVSQMTFFFRFDNGKQFAYYGSNNGNIRLYPIVNGKWQLMISFWDGDFQQNFMTDMVDYYGSSNLINLRLEIKEKNVKSTVQMDKNFIYGAYNIQLGGYDKDGNYSWVSYPVSYDDGLPARISFDSYLDIKDVVICGVYGCAQYSTNNSKITAYMSDGRIVYSF